MTKGWKLLMSDSVNDADMFFVSGVLVPDPFICLVSGSRAVALVNGLEFDRVSREASSNVVVLPVEPIVKAARDAGLKDISLATVAFMFLKQRRISHVEVAPEFPVIYADELRRRGVKVVVASPLFDRAVKSPAIVKKIATVQSVVDDACRLAFKILRDADVRAGFLYHEGHRLTSEFLKHAMNRYFLDHGLENVEGLILSSGPDTAMPHLEGSGPIKEGVPIVFDVFPRSAETRYFSDMTRTVCRGAPKNPKILEIFNLVKRAQEEAFKMIKPGVAASKVHEAAVNYFTHHHVQKYFTHAVGHGVGLNIHEAPSVPSSTILKPGMVITNEPGLYIPGVGGVRIEDTVVVTRSGYKNLCRLPKKLIL